jgi:DNA-binding transcriptional MerR regulator
VDTKRYYSITEVAQLLDVSASAIRFWETEFGSYLNPRKDNAGKRLFTSKDVEHLQHIKYLLKEQGLTIEGARKIINKKQQTDDTNAALIEKLQRLQKYVIKLKDGL